MQARRTDVFVCACVFGCRCCHAHDKCWERSREQLGCNDLDSLPYLVDYDFTCSNKRVTCSGELPVTTTEAFQLSAPPLLTHLCLCACAGSNNVCAAAVCECDREAAHCFARNSYNPEYKYLDRNTYC